MTAKQVKENQEAMLQIRVLVNNLCDKLGTTYSTRYKVLADVLNETMNGDLLFEKKPLKFWHAARVIINVNETTTN